MKYCPSCGSSYSDSTLEFCLQDGARLSGEGRGSAVTESLGETETVVRQHKNTSDVQNRLSTGPGPVRVKGLNPIGIAALTAAGIGIVFGALVLGWWIFRGGGSGDSSFLTNANSHTPIVMPTPSPSIIKGDDGDEGWGPIEFQASLDGERLTYYPGTTYQHCQEDCNGNPRCRGFTFINQGTYNPGDSAMCYLLASVTNSKFTASHISRVKK